MLIDEMKYGTTYDDSHGTLNWLRNRVGHPISSETYEDDVFGLCRLDDSIEQLDFSFMYFDIST